VLTVVPTPLGNLRDITLRALDALRAADVIACEDTRRTRALLSAHDIPAPELVACDERREPHVAERLIARALSGDEVALVSDSGMPLIADPVAFRLAAHHLHWTGLAEAGDCGCERAATGDAGFEPVLRI